MHLQKLWDRNVTITTRLVDTTTAPMRPARESLTDVEGGGDDRSKYRAVVGTKYARELILK